MSVRELQIRCAMDIHIDATRLASAERSIADRSSGPFRLLPHCCSQMSKLFHSKRTPRLPIAMALRLARPCSVDPEYLHAAWYACGPQT